MFGSKRRKSVPDECHLIEAQLAAAIKANRSTEARLEACYQTLTEERAFATKRYAFLSAKIGTTVIVTPSGRWKITPHETGLAYEIECRGTHKVSGVISRDTLDGLAFPAQPEQPDAVVTVVNDLGVDATLAAINASLGTDMTWRDLRGLGTVEKIPGTKPGVYRVV